LNYIGNLVDKTTFKPSRAELALVLESLLASRAMLMEDGLAATRKSEGDKLVMLNLEQGDVERVLGEVGGTRWKNALTN
jgi:origin recognition complex subunit 1